jgi:hypothetical protein
MGTGGIAAEAKAVPGYDTSTTVLACYSGSGFHHDLRTAARRTNTLLATLNDMYPGTG